MIHRCCNFLRFSQKPNKSLRSYVVPNHYQRNLKQSGCSIKPFAHVTLLSPFSFYMFPSLINPYCVDCLYLFVCVCVRVCICLMPLCEFVCVDTALLSTTSSLCSRPTTGPLSVFVFPTFTLNSSSLSTTSWSGTVHCSVLLS